MFTKIKPFRPFYVRRGTWAISTWYGQTRQCTKCLHTMLTVYTWFCLLGAWQCNQWWSNRVQCLMYKAWWQCEVRKGPDPPRMKGRNPGQTFHTKTMISDHNKRTNHTIWHIQDTSEEIVIWRPNLYLYVIDLSHDFRTYVLTELHKK